MMALVDHLLRTVLFRWNVRLGINSALAKVLAIRIQAFVVLRLHAQVRGHTNVKMGNA